MSTHIMKIVAAIVFGFTVSGVANGQILDRWFVREIYSNADGSVQFLRLEFDLDVGAAVGLKGVSLIASDGVTERTFLFASEPVYAGFFAGAVSGDRASVLVATQGFVDLNVGRPAAVMPNGFLFTPSGVVKLVADEVHYNALPIDGVHALWPHGFYWGDADVPVVGTPQAIDLFMPGRNEVVEYHNGDLDDYFLSAFPTELDLLDSGTISGWQRTGQTFRAWTGSVSVLQEEIPPPSLLPVCRVWLGASHFYSISAIECAEVAQFPAGLEIRAAFFATLPNPDTGACPVGQAPAYRLWNPQGSNHRYTTQTAVRDDMKSRGWIPEGYGLDPVSMCVGGDAR